MALIFTPAVNKKPTRVEKAPDFGFILMDENGEFIRATYVVLEALYKVPDTNCIPTIIAAGVDFDNTTYNQIIDKLIEAGYEDDDKIIEQIIALRTLMTYPHRVNTITLNRFPFCKVRLLNEKQLNDINSICGINLEYEVYKLAIPVILSKENLKDVFAQLGVAVMPEINLAPEAEKTTTTNTDVEQLRKLIEMKKKQKQ